METSCGNIPQKRKLKKPSVGLAGDITGQQKICVLLRWKKCSYNETLELSLFRRRGGDSQGGCMQPEVEFRKYPNGWVAVCEDFISNPHFSKKDAKKEVLRMRKNAIWDEAARLSHGFLMIDIGENHAESYESGWEE
jgi:hypothetical protein